MSGCSHHSREPCHLNFMKGFFKSFISGLGVKLLVKTLVSRFRLSKVFKNLSDVWRFSLMCGLFSALYKFTRCILRYLKIKIDKDLEVFLASAISSISLLIATRSDLNLLKIFIYPRAIEALYNLSIEKGLIRPIKHGEFLAALLANTIYTYNYIFEP